MVDFSKCAPTARQLPTTPLTIYLPRTVALLRMQVLNQPLRQISRLV